MEIIDKELIIKKTMDFVKTALKNAETGHDWWHSYRVWKLALQIAKDEIDKSADVDLFTVELGALLHDIADPKFYDGDEQVGPSKAKDFLSSLEVNNDVIVHVVQIITNVSFGGGNFAQKFKSPELDIVQDADRMDAIGAIGIARTFNYGGYRNRAIYDPNIKPNLNMTKEEYIKDNFSSLNHFYEKLLLVKDRMNTRSGREIAEHRHEFVQQFLDEFLKEWDGER